MFSRSLTFKTVVFIILTEIIILSLTGSIYVGNFNRELAQRIRGKLLLPATLMDKGILDLDTVTDREQMRELVGENLINAFVIGINHNIFYSLNSEFTGQDVENVPEIDSSIIFAEDLKKAIVLRDKKNHYVSISPLFGIDGQSIRFYLYLESDNNTIRQKQAANIRLFVSGSLITVLVTTLIILIAFNYTIFHPINNILAALKQVEQGDLTVRIAPADSPDELGRLQRYQNRVIERLQKLFQTLEQQVEARTSELKEAKEQAEKSSQVKSTFLNTMSHELRTPLNAILGYAQILKRSELDEEIIDKIGIIQNSGEHLLTLINEILDIAKIEAGKTELHPNPFNLPVFLDSISSIMLSRAKLENIEFIKSFSPDLPENIIADETRLRQILLNLLGNAVKFTSDGVVTFSVEPKDLSPDKPIIKIRFEIKDTGPGIPSDELELIFRPFEQISDRRNQRSGTGLGLPICRNLVELMHGELGVESILGAGSLFWFELDLEVSDRSIITTPELPGKISGYLGKRRVLLVVDDISSNRSVITDLLSPLGFTVKEAENGEEAVDIVKTDNPDLILMDQWMPKMNGDEAVRQIRNIPGLGKIPVITISASVSEEERMKCINAGYSDFLPKPVNWRTLSQLLEKHLSLEWEYMEDSRTTVKTTEQKVIIRFPPEEEIIKILNMANIGNLARVRQQAENIGRKDEKYRDFCQRILYLADHFESSKLMNFLEDSQKKTRDGDS